MANERDIKLSRIKERRENESLAPLKHKQKRSLQIIRDSPELEKSTHVKDKPKHILRIIEDSPEIEKLTHVKLSKSTHNKDKCTMDDELKDGASFMVYFLCILLWLCFSFLK
ncbi:uncharacterized protein LOC133804081 [Humulus lupulus]|uniref:uncharacterized protein LOC133804081 n=1 Tax=Humulus lupulus TaxID=3486 RepID=UPI002B4123BC|nr:uncharacterized protein LOC133804081 [Humulus lupulus]